ncbi:MAG: ATP-dependent DNA helicase [Candidatus Pacebacteria bacterium]|nr:ATP-dependent DNA helicase [Candidatus Paceibacterota bacterium]
MSAFSSTEFDLQYNRLNKAQKDAVDTIEGPVMVIAGPGTGKTTILTLRIANILKQTDTPAHGILAITYTDAGVKAMRSKLHKVIGNRAHEVAIHTFHSFAAAMIAEYPDHFLHLDGRKHMADVEQESIIRSIIEAPEFADIHPLGKPDAYVPAILHSIDTSKREALTPDMVREHAQKQIQFIKNDESSISTRGATKGQLKADALEQIAKCEKTMLFAEVYRLYELKKKELKRMDFNDLLTELLRALQNTEDNLFLRLIQERFLYVMVDEHQDTNDSQNQIIALIADFFETPNIFIVGDEKQAIYRFQGASVENFLLLQKRWPTMKLISLDTNYRSHQNILDAGFSMIENNYEGDEHRELRVELKSGVSVRGLPSEKLRPLDIITGENVAAIEAQLVKELKEITEKEPGATVAIITRRNRDLERVIRLLESAHVPVSSERSVDIFHHPIGATFFDILEYLNDPSHVDSLGRTLVAGLWNISFENVAVLIKELRSGQVEGLEKKIPVLLHLQRKILNDGALAYIIEAAEMSGFTELVAYDPAYVHVWRGIVTLAESLAREGNIQNPRELIASLLAYRLSAESKTVKVSVGAPDLPIQAMTAHGSKGLEFDYVFIPYATEESWIGRARGASFILPQKKVIDHDVRDTRRLFYVAITRARKHATILTALEESDGKGLTPLRFIGELSEKTVKQITLARLGAEVADIKKDQSTSTQNDYSSKILNLSKKVLLDTGLSVTALNNFLDCPSKFIYNSILKLPQAPSSASEKGTAMHEAMDHIWKIDGAQGRPAHAIEEVIKKSVEDYFKTSFLATNEKNIVTKELFEDAPVVAKALESHFSVNASVATERWVKTTFNGEYDTTQITIPIHGKLDAIVEVGNEVNVFDYKTKQSMSEAEIKGETKNSNGDYFRQLTFYKLLLQDDPRWKFKKIIPALVFISPDKKGRCPIVTLPIADADIEKVKKDIHGLLASVWSGDIITAHCGDNACYWCGLKQVRVGK